jgi:hypothetical protein
VTLVVSVHHRDPVSVFYLHAGALRCPRCRSNLAGLILSRPSWRIDPRLRVCPYCELGSTRTRRSFSVTGDPRCAPIGRLFRASMRFGEWLTVRIVCP